MRGRGPDSTVTSTRAAGLDLTPIPGGAESLRRGIAMDGGLAVLGGQAGPGVGAGVVPTLIQNLLPNFDDLDRRSGMPLVEKPPAKAKAETLLEQIGGRRRASL